VSCPHKRALLKEIEHKLVVLALIFFTLVTSARMGSVKIWHTFTTVFGVSETAIRIAIVEVIHPNVVKPHKRSVPTEVEIPAYNVGKMTHGVEWRTHCIASERCRTAGVHLVNEIVEKLVIVEHISAFCR
jgi:hypothetical protein